MTEPGDLLLTWASEVGSGKLRPLLDGAEWLARAHGIRPGPGAAGRWVRDMSSLGFIDVDWASGVWSISPLVVTRIPQSDGLAVIAGRRDVEAARREEDDEEGVLVTPVPNRLAEGDIPLPASRIVAYNSHLDLPQLAERLGAQWVPCFALLAAHRIPVLTKRAPAAPPVRGEPIEHFGLADRAFTEWRERSYSDGLYRLRRSDRKKVYQFHEAGEWHHTTWEEGVYLALDKSPHPPIRWRRDPAQGRESIGQLIVEWGAPLPPLHSRVATLCLGLAPTIGSTAETMVYDNVPKDVAKKIAHSLKQPLANAL